MRFFAEQKSVRKQAVALMTVLCCSAICARGEVIVSSLNNTSSVVGFPPGAWAASSFTTDTQSWTLASATLRLELGAPAVSVASVHLMSDNAGRPGASVLNLGTNVVTNAASFTFAAPAQFALQPSTTYWLAVGSTGTNGGLNVSFSEQGGAFTNDTVSGALMPLSVVAGGSTNAEPPVSWGPPTFTTALLFSIEGTRSGGGGGTNSPQLTIENVDPQSVVVMWPTNAANFALEFSTNVASQVSWMAFTNVPTVMSNRFVQQVTTTNSTRLFFRLRQQ